MQVLGNFKRRLLSYLQVVCLGECHWGLGMAAEDDKKWTCNGAVVQDSDFRYILFGGPYRCSASLVDGLAALYRCC